MKQQIIQSDYDGQAIQFSADGWFNATSAAEKYGKRLDHWFANAETRAYMEALAEAINTRDSGYLIADDLVRTKRGRNGGTWMHPKLAVAFARWCDAKFAVWCDLQIDQLVRGTGPAFDPIKLRHEAASSYKVMSDILHGVRAEIGKATQAHHYMNEAKLINRALTGSACSLDRDQLSTDELRVLAKLEERNSVLIGRGLDYQQRKAIIEQYAIDLRAPRIAQENAQ